MATRSIYERGFDENVQTSSNTNRCPECDGQVSTNAVELICEDCGLVIDEQWIDHGPEWRVYDADECKRTGAPLTVTRHDRGLSTEIGRGRDANGNALSGRKRRQVARMRREQSRGRFQSKAERNLAHGLTETRRIVSALELPNSIRDQACALFRSASKEGLLPGRSIEAIAAASVYAACRCNGLPRMLPEIGRVAAVETSRVEAGYSALNRELGIPAKPPSPINFVTRIVSNVGLSDETRRQAEEVAKRAIEAGVGNGCHPGGFAAGCVYMVAQSNDENPSQKVLADCVGVSDATVRARWKELRKDGRFGEG